MAVFSTQRHMRVHAAIVVLVLLAAYLLGVTTTEFLHLLAAIAFVMITEMFNTAIEYTIDLTVREYEPRARIAKDIAAGAVLMASIYAVVVGTVIFGNNENLRQALRQIPHVPPRPHLLISVTYS